MFCVKSRFICWVTFEFCSKALYFADQGLIMSTEAKVEESVPQVELSPAELAKK